MIEELLLGGNLTATELLLEELEQFRVLLHGNGLLALLKVVLGALERRRKVASLLLYNKAFES